MIHEELTISVSSDPAQELLESNEPTQEMTHHISHNEKSKEHLSDSPSPPVASLLPWRSSGPESGSKSKFGSGSECDIEIKLYIVTGYHGKLKIPESFCRECNLFVRAADAAAAQVDVDVDVSVVSWWTHFPFALRYGGYHPPVIVVEGTRLSQGHQVPTTESVVEAIKKSMNR